MIKLRNAVLAAAAALLATGALAQGFSQDSESVTVPEELFGGDAVKLEFGAEGFEPKAELVLVDAGSLNATTKFSVTYTLANATFAESASNADIKWGYWGRADTDVGGLDCDTNTTPADTDPTFATQGVNIKRLVFCEMASEVSISRSGGAKDSNSVTYEFEVPALLPATGTLAALALVGGTDAATADDYTDTETRMIRLLVPDVNATGLHQAYPAFGVKARSVTVAVSVTQETSGGTATTISEDIAMGNMCGMTMVSEDPNATVSCPVVMAHAVVTGITNSGGSGEISLAPEDGRAVLVDSKGKAVDPQRIKLSDVQLTADFGDMNVKDQDGSETVQDFTGALDGNLAIRVSSDNFNDGDVVYIDFNSNKKPDGREAFDMSPGLASSDTLDLGGGKYTVYYQPNGKDAMSHRATFKINAHTEFADRNARTRSAEEAEATLKLNGIQDTAAQAYAIAPLTSTDTANVRVTCESPLGCSVFLDCKEPDGTATFGEAGAMIEPLATVRWTQSDVAAALDMEDGWTGRLACEVLSTRKISVQVLTRAAGVLVNNTAVSTGGTPAP